MLRDRATEAAATWSRLLAIQPPAKECDQPSVLRAAASALNATGDRAGAARLYARLLKAHGDDAESMLALARIAATDGRIAEAELRFRRYLRLKPDDPWAWYDLGEMLAAHGLGGRKELTEALRRLPQDERADYLAVRAACQHRLGHDEEAIRLYQRAMERGGGGAIAGDFAVLLIELDRQVQANQVLAMGRLRAPADRRLKQLAAALQIADGRSREALALLRSMGAERSDDRSLLGDLGTAAEGSGAWTDAMRAYGAAAGDVR